MMGTNPFEVLQLDPAATEEEIVRQAERLRQRATDEELLGAIRQAAMCLTGSPEERQLHALRTHPRPGYLAPSVERFTAAFRRPPASAQAQSPCPTVDQEEFVSLLLAAAAEELESVPQPFEPVAPPDGAEELQRQMEEALLHGLLGDMRG